MIKLVRLDYRLLHGQVVFSWTGHVGAQRIIVVDDDAANDEDAAGQDAADDDVNATGDDADESNIASSQTGGAMYDAAMVGVGSIAGILTAAASPPSHN